MMPELSPTDVARFWARVDSSQDGCWPWQPLPYGENYGSFCHRGRTYKAHRVAYELTHGAIPDGLLILHACDYPPCCNPAHLRAGSASENLQDAVARGRWGRDLCAPYRPRGPRRPSRLA